MSSTASAVFKPGAPGLMYPHIAPGVAVAIACVASFMVVMDGAIVNVALPAMQADLGLSPVALQWVVDAYLLMLGGFMLLAARAGDLFGRKRVLQYGLFLFTLASLAGGLATSGPWLLAARALQGFGASALATSTLAVIVAVHPTGAPRARAISQWAASSSIASALGVVVGGVLTTQANWRWVMYVNVPIGVGLMAAVALCLAPSRPNAQSPGLDIPGAVAATLGMGALMVGVSQSVSQGWGSTMVLSALVAAIVLIAAFFVIQSRVQNPLVRPSIWRVHNVRMGNVVVLCLGASLTASTFFTSMVLQNIAGYSALDTGLALLPMGLTLAVAAIVSRPLMDGGMRRLPFFGGLISAVGLLWMHGIPTQPVWLVHVLGPTLLMGLGLGLMLMTATHTAMDGVPPHDAGLASGLFNTARQLGAALGIAGLSTLAQWLARGAVATQSEPLAMLHGYHGVFVATAVLSAVAAFTSLTLRRVA